MSDEPLRKFRARKLDPRDQDTLDAGHSMASVGKFVASLDESEGTGWGGFTEPNSGPLADLAHAWTYRDRLKRHKLSKEVLAVQFRYRAKLRQAERFIIDDSSARLTCHLSHEQKRLESWMLLRPVDSRLLGWNQCHEIREPSGR
jgi:hypothetical protein